MKNAKSEHKDGNDENHRKFKQKVFGGKTRHFSIFGNQYSISGKKLSLVRTE